jgi:chorismate--pyruvate lyase
MAVMMQWGNVYFDPTSPLLALMKTQDSLTARLRQLAKGQVRVEIIRQSWQSPSYTDATYLKMPHAEKVWMREIYLTVNNEKCIYAQSLMPRHTLVGQGRKLKQLQARPLIEILNTDPNLTRGEIQITQLLPAHSDFKQAVRYLSEMPTQLWARRSIFYFYGKPILVKEIFLPGIALHLPKNK